MPKPRTMPGLRVVELSSTRSVSRDQRAAVETVVEADANEIVGNVRLRRGVAVEAPRQGGSEGGIGGQRRHVVDAAEIDMKIFELGRPVAPQHGFHADADRPAPPA